MAFKKLAMLIFALIGSDSTVCVDPTMPTWPLLIKQFLFSPIILSSFLLSWAYLFLRRRPTYSAGKKPTVALPPGPPGLPFIGNLHQFLVDPLPHRAFRRLSDRYGPLMYVRLGAVRSLVVSSADMARQALRTHDLAFSDRPPLKSPLRFSYGRRTIAGAPYGEDLVQTRRLVMGVLLGAKKQARLRPVREDEVGLLMASIARLSAAEEAINLTEMALCLFNNINRRVISGRRFTEYGDICRSNPMHQMFLEVNDLLPGFSNSDLFPGMPWLDVLTGRHGRIEKRFHDIDRFLEGEIAVNDISTADLTAGGHEAVDAVDKPEEDDRNYVRTLLHVWKEYPKLRQFLDRDKIKAILLDLFVGGAQSSMSSLEWAMAELVMKPDAMKKAQDEVRRVVGGKPRIDEDDLEHLDYMKQVLKETWRLHPTGPLLIPRQCREDCNVGGYTVPAKTLVHVNVWAIGRDPRYWADPEVFRPERFEDGAVDYKGQNFLLLPFGTGRRMCPGMAPGVTRLELALANLLLKFNWELPAGLESRGLDMEEAFGISNRRRSPLLLRAVPTMI